MGFDAAVVLGNLEIMNRKWPGQEFGITEINVILLGQKLGVA